MRFRFNDIQYTTLLSKPTRSVSGDGLYRIHSNLSSIIVECFTGRHECGMIYDDRNHLVSSKLTVAHCMTGDIRTLCREDVYESIRKHVLRGKGNHHLYMVVSLRQIANCSVQQWFTAMLRLAPVFIQVSGSGAFEKHQE
jgi:hypothetical protein